MHDATTGLNLAIRRVQDPATGKWLSEDPIRFAAGDPNLDRYVGNVPNSLLDDLGLQQAPSQKPKDDKKPKIGIKPPEGDYPFEGEPGECIMFEVIYDDGPPDIQGHTPTYHGPTDLLPGGYWEYPPGGYRRPKGGWGVVAPPGFIYMPPASKYPTPKAPKSTEACRKGVFFFPNVYPTDNPPPVVGPPHLTGPNQGPIYAVPPNEDPTKPPF